MIAQTIALVTGAVTLAGMWLAGSKRAAGWLLGLANQVLWFAFIVVFDAWGLLPLNVALVVVYGRNLWAWRRDAHADVLVRPDGLERLAEQIIATRASADQYDADGAVYQGDLAAARSWAFGHAWELLTGAPFPTETSL